MNLKKNKKHELLTIDRCPLCHRDDGFSIKKIVDKVAYKKTHFLIKDVELYDCRHCKEGFYTPRQFGELSDKINTAIRKHDHLLLAEEIAQIRKKTGLSQQALAKKLGLSIKSFSKWEANQDVHSVQMDNLLRAIKRDLTLVDYLASFRKAA